jgi:quinol monooxygenase YgiN
MTITSFIRNGRESYVKFLVHSHIRADHVEKCREVTLEDTKASLGEEGWVRFDVLQQTADPTCVTFIEIFKSEEAGAIHREANHNRSA